MTDFAVFTGFLTQDLVGAENMANGQSFTVSDGQISGVNAVSLIFADTTGDDVIQGDRNTQENQDDVDDDQRVFIHSSGGAVIVDGGGVYLELSFQFTVNGAGNFTGYQFEVEGTGQDFVILETGVPDGTASVFARDFTPGSGAGAAPGQDNVDLDDLLIGDQGFNADLFSNFDTATADPDVIVGGDGGDTLTGQQSADDISGGLGADSLVGGDGQDTIDGGDGNDTIFGDAGDFAAERQVFRWSDIPDPSDGGATPIDNNETIASQSLDTGLVTVNMSITDNGSLTSQRFDIAAVNVAGIVGNDGSVEANSSLELRGDNSGLTPATLTLDFTSNSTAFEDEVEDVSFNILDVDGETFIDQVQILAFDADDNQVAVTLTGGSEIDLSDGDTLAGDDTGTSSASPGNSNFQQDDPEATVNVFIAGPVARIDVIYTNAGSPATQAINVSDIYFDVIAAEGSFDDVIDGGDGDDLIDGNGGDDVVDGGAGDDTITVADDDTITGGTGADTFVVTDEDDSNVVITDFDTATGIVGGQDPADQAGNDFADLSGFFDRLGDMRDANLSGPGDDVVLDLGGGQTLTFEGVTDADELTFENTNVVCFARGTMIRTPCGETRIEDLDVGDRVITRDHRRQRIRWHGVRTVAANGDMAPIVLKTGAVGNRRDLVVSPLHRILLTGMRAMVHCGAPEVLVTAKHLVNGDTVYQREGGEVEYHHILFDEHEIIYANGAPAESLHPGKDNLDGFGEESREELLKIFPELREDAMSYGPSARPSVRSYEARVLGS